MPLLLAGACLKLLVGLAAWCLVPATAPGRSPASLSPWLHAIALVVFAASGLILAVGGRRDERSRSLGATFVLLASVFADPLLDRVAPVLPGWPAVIARFAVAAQPAAYLPLTLWLFVRDFPHARSPIDRWLNPAFYIRLSAIVGTALLLSMLAPLGRTPGPAWFTAPLAWLAGDFWFIVALLIVPAVALMIARTGNALEDERRRVRLFVAGWILGSLPTVLEIILEATVPAVAGYVAVPAHSRVVGYVLSGFLLLIPLTTAYAVVVDRVFDVGFIVRRAIQYALARYTVLGLLAVPVALLVAYLYNNRLRPIGEIFLSTSVSTWSLTAAAADLLWVRRPLLASIDRRFFREHYDTQQVLTQLVEASRRAASSRDLAALIAGEVDRALHVEQIAVLLRDERAGLFREPNGSVPPLATASALAGLIGGSGSPLVVDLSSPGSPLQRLPQTERQWLADVGAQLFVPFLAGDDRPLGILLLGDKLSGVPFTAEDQMLLRAAVASAALVLENRLRIESGPGPETTVNGDAESGARQCVRCGKVHEYTARVCAECGGSLAEALLPQLLRAKFRLERQIGAGGMGVVHLARDLALQRDVALKSLPRVSPEHAGRLRREARSMASVQHENLAIIHGLEVWRGVPVLVLEYFSAGTLADRLRVRALAPAEVVELGLSIAGALDHLHRSGLLHRDIKPSNIGFRSDGVPKLLDFGLVRLAGRLPGAQGSNESTAADSAPALEWPAPPGRDDSVDDSFHTRANQLVGTTAYLSPEAVALQPPDPSFDLWSLALTLYEAATRTNPFAGRDTYDTIHRIASAGAPDLADVLPGCPTGLAVFFRLALSRARQDRPSTALEFSAALRSLGVQTAC